MIAVIFEVKLKAGYKNEYLEVAAMLRSELSKIEGFISIERFQSLTEADKLLSLSFWQDEQAIERWRNIELHRNAQSKGRNYIFDDYRIRVATVGRDYGMTGREQVPSDSRIRFD